MALANINPVVSQPKQGKGGVLGSILGTAPGLALGIGSLIAAPFTAGSTLPLAGAGFGAAGAGGMIGGMIGNKVDPSTPGSQSAAAPVQETSRKAPLSQFQENPEVQLATLMNAKKQLPQANLPGEQMSQYGAMLDEAGNRIRQNLGYA
jgi:hypothetical protein